MLGREIVKKCGSLPLAIKTTAASLANTDDLSQWEFKRNRLLGGNDAVKDILKLSYDSLPPHLKPCFSYLSFFAEDEEIEPEYLVYLWIGEGFIPAGDEQLDTACDWLDKLAQLCLVELWEDTSKSLGELSKHCKVHDLLHELAIHISEENSCALSVEEARRTGAGTERCRILLAQKDIDNRALSRSRPPYVRTLSLSGNGRIRRIPENMFNAMRGLRVLDLRWTRISALPACVGKMILLKVLNLKGTMIKRLPKCVRNLKGLLFLAMPEIEECEECLRLPKWITELERLQHLEVPNVSFEHVEISKMVSLRTLRSVLIELPIEEDLAKLTHLREVELKVKNEMEVAIVAQLVNLRRLKEFPQLEKGAMPYLEDFELKGCTNLIKVGEGLELLERLRSFDFICTQYSQQGLVDLFVEGGEYLNKIRAMNPRVSVETRPLLNIVH